MSETNLSSGLDPTPAGNLYLPHEVVLVVKMNGHDALILKHPVKKVFYKMDDKTIIATDGVFYTFYAKDYYS